MSGRHASLAVAGQQLLLDPSGALYEPRAGALVVADLHLEKGSSFARRGMMLPPYDTAATLARLTQAIMRWRPRVVVALGDSFHDREGFLPRPRGRRATERGGLRADFRIAGGARLDMDIRQSRSGDFRARRRRAA